MPTAVNWAATLSDPADREQHLRRTISDWRQFDPGPAEAYLESDEVPDEVQARFDNLVSYEDRFNDLRAPFDGGEVVIVEWDASPGPSPGANPPEENNDSLEGMDDWDAGTLETRLENLRSLPAAERDERLRELAWDYHLNHNQNETRPELRGLALQHFLERGAHEGAEEAPANLSRKTIDHAARWARVDAPRAAQWATGLPVGVEREWAVRNVARIWAGQAPSEARAWASSLPAGKERSSALREIEQAGR